MTGSAPNERDDSRTDGVLSSRTILLCAVAVAVIATGACWILFARYGHGTEADRVRLDGIRTVGTIVVGTGGALALLLAARRQQTAERDLATKRAELRLREQANDDIRRDAAERRTNELYLKAVEQLGAEQAPVRLVGLYALDSLAQENPRLRPTLANVLSAYLRMPYDLPSDSADLEPRREREVRLTAQRLLVQHLVPGAPRELFWNDVELDLSGAVLFDFTLNGAALHNACFTDAQFVGDAWFHEATFTGTTSFDHAVFEQDAWFLGATFTGNTRFDHAVFRQDAHFEDTEFAGTTLCRFARFERDASFDRALLRGVVYFSRTKFDRNTRFSSADFVAAPVFEHEATTQGAYFDSVRFGEEAWFDRVSFANYTTFDNAAFDGHIGFDGTTLNGDPYRPPQLQSDRLSLDDAV
ncbi:pentapeptide repeat-containing protein [Amycolatopsis rubida]|uniref:Pentapeptide repeat-containing protein n=1 Tax=Amycolatopsis rubida TaxID=112413 RepID=A0A1I6A3Q9_9PSEU|nr:pentapeptide repeat-containing protein [Amycolatopsis rubida]SFQ63290.1 Pentapeptide repeat-containing protein [Amycolatopsis rubida]